MTESQVLEVVRMYRTKLEELGFEPCDYPHERMVSGMVPTLNHCASMLPKMEVFVKNGQMDKAFRWLGFVQGILWTKGLFTLEELKSHNR